MFISIIQFTRDHHRNLGLQIQLELPHTELPTNADLRHHRPAFQPRYTAPRVSPCPTPHPQHFQRERENTGARAREREREWENRGKENEKRRGNVLEGHRMTAMTHRIYTRIFLLAISSTTLRLVQLIGQHGLQIQEPFRLI
jgi:hypothetical protein